METIAKKALELVEDLNNEVIERGGMEYYAPFEFKSIGWQGSAIYFMGISIWLEQDDEREYINDEPEPLRNFIIRQSAKVLKDLNMKMGAFLIM